MKIKVITQPVAGGGPYQVGLSVFLEEGRTTDIVPKWLVSRISKALGGSGEVDLVDEVEYDGEKHPLWHMDLPGPYDGRLEVSFDVYVETPLP
jgi:hypothetical protein